MRRLFSSRVPLVVLAALVGGFAGARFTPHDAHAQSLALGSNFYVPADGIVFRNFQGKVVARLAHDSHGGIFELYDENEQVRARVRPESNAPAAAPTPSRTPIPLDIIDTDPFQRKAPTPPPRPSGGF
jgi:hypothetical protein